MSLSFTEKEERIRVGRCLVTIVTLSVAGATSRCSNAMMRRMALHGITHNHWAVKGSPLLESFFNLPLRQTAT